MASSHAAPFVVDPDAKAKADPNKRHRWFIPLLLAAQIAFKVSFAVRSTPRLPSGNIMSEHHICVRGC